MTIAEIAKRAGVSKTAVSRYLNQGYVSEEKRAAIQRVIDETNYVPSQQARTLRTGKSRTIGVIVPRIDSESISRVVAGISKTLDESGYHLLLANTENKLEKELEYLEVLRNGNVDGIIFIATVLTPAHKKAIRESGVPVVLIGQQMAGVSCVYHDDQAAAQAMTARIAGNGRTRIAYIGVTTRDKAAGAARRAGYLDALRCAGLAQDETLMEQSGFSVDGGFACAAGLLQRAPELDGIFCATDSIAVGALRCLLEAGRRVPQDVAVTGIGDSRLAALVSPRLTTAHYYYETSGEEAARDLLHTLVRNEMQIRQLKLGFTVVLQQSCP